MNILSAEGISKSFSEKIIINGIDLGINEGEKIGLIGINGTGKSTLLKIIAGIEAVDAGKIIKGSSIRTEYLPQNPYFEPGTTVLQQVFKGNSPVMELIRQYEDVLHQVEQCPGDLSMEKKLTDLTHKMDTMDGWTIESEAKSILTRLGIFDFQADVGILSGGQRKRVAIASALISPADLLILDEPTNHIDSNTVDWLEKYLDKRKGALLMVTHDRYFLDRVANRIIELYNGKLYSYQGNYSKYLEMKAEREEAEQSIERKRQNLIRSELEWIRRGAQARSTKQKARIDRFEKLQEEQGNVRAGNVEIKVGSSRLGKKIIELENVSKAFSEANVISDFSYILLRDDRIGIIGPNGSGKSTLLKIITRQLEPDRGSVITGETVKIGFFSQENEEMNESLRVIDYIREEAEFIEVDGVKISASQMLETFLFPPEVQWTPISKLSGGEKRRLYLLRILMGMPNILILDEPTNDLDIQTLTVLENYIDEFPGAVIVVSHDRYFLDRTADKIFSFEGEGIIKQFTGGYSDYFESLRNQEKTIEENYNKKSADKKSDNAPKKDRPLKFTFKEQKEFDEIDDLIADTEKELEEINQEIDISSSDFQRLQELLLKKQSLEDHLNQLIERWAYLNELAEKISKSKKN